MPLPANPSHSTPSARLRATILTLALALPWLAAGSEPIGLGPIWDQFELTLEPGKRTEVMGPLYYRQELESERTWAFPPLLSYTRDPELDVTEFDFAYPLLTYDDYGGQWRWQLFQLLSFAGGATQTETEKTRYTLFPIFFMQRSSDPTENYTAYGPFYGNIKHRLMRDEIHYVMFPFYSKTWKRGVVTRNYLWPILHLREGPGLQGWQVWPFAGHELKEVTWETNRFGDLQLLPGHEKRFVAWPVYFNETTGIGTTNVAQEYGMIPFYSVLRSPLRDSTTVIWPLFSYIDDREKRYEEWRLPWPVLVYAKGEGKHTKRVFPLFGLSSSPTLESDFFLWPAYKFNRAHSETYDRTRTRVALFVFSDVNEKNLETGKSRRRLDFWPLFTHRRELNGNTRWQLLAPLEPFVPGSHKIERDYSPVWALWRAERNPSTGAASQSLLWNLYRHDTTPESSRTSALFGLYQRTSSPAGARTRILFIPFGKKPAAQKSAPPSP